MHVLLNVTNKHIQDGDFWLSCRVVCMLSVFMVLAVISHMETVYGICRRWSWEDI